MQVEITEEVVTKFKPFRLVLTVETEDDLCMLWSYFNNHDGNLFGISETLSTWKILDRKADELGLSAQVREKCRTWFDWLRKS